MNINQQAFIQKITDENNPTTFGNGTQAYKQAYPGVKDSNVAKSAASRLLTNVNVKNAIQAIIESKGLSIEVRIGRLKKIVKGTAKRRVETFGVVRDQDGKPILDDNGKEQLKLQQVTVQPVPFSDQLKAIEITNRMDGTYERVKVAGDVARSEIDALYRDVMKGGRKSKPRNVTPTNTDTSVLVQARARATD